MEKVAVKSVAEVFFQILGNLFGGPTKAVLFLAVFFSVLYWGLFFILAGRSLLDPDPEALRQIDLRFKWHDLLRWLIVDMKTTDSRRDEFGQYGMTVYVGRQGAGKTMAMVDYLERMRDQFPQCLIVTNFGYDGADMRMKDWRDFLEIRNDEQGVIFAIDEIQSEFSAAAWKDFPESLLSEVCQQRKQRVKIVATAQYFTRIAKPLREQAKTVVTCKTSFGRLTRTREYDALDYAMLADGATRHKMKSLSRHSFVQSDELRSSYDTYEKIKRMSKEVFIPRDQRGAE